MNNQSTLSAFDPKHRDLRKFVLFRLAKHELTAEKFTVSGKFDLNRELSGGLGVYEGGDDYEVVVDFDACGADDVRGRRWHSSQELMELPKGMLRVLLRLNSLEEIAGRVLSFGTHATVAAPEELRRRAFSATEELWQRYGGPMVLHGG